LFHNVLDKIGYFYGRKDNIFSRFVNDFSTFKALEITSFAISDFLCNFAPKSGFGWECGEIWLLATTLKNAKMLT
jgi:hypothetical protein